MINRKTPVQTVESANTGDSYNCATRALIDYNTDYGTVTIPWGFFRELMGRVSPERSVRNDLKIELIRKLINKELVKDPESHYIKIDEIRMVIEDE